MDSTAPGGNRAGGNPVDGRDIDVDGNKRGDPDYGNGEDGKPGTFAMGDGPDAMAGWISGAQWAEELGVSKDEPIAKQLGPDGWKVVLRHCRRFEIELLGDQTVTFAEFDALPQGVWRGVELAVEVTRRQVAEFTEDVGGANPHEIGRRLQAQRSKRFRQRDEMNKTLNPKGISAETVYTLAQVEKVCGSEVARAARLRIDRQNRMAWAAIKPHNLTERTDLMTAAELVTKYRVTSESLVAMTAATADEHLDALERHGRARKQYEKRGAAEVIDVAAGMVPPSKMMNQSPPRQLIGHLIYESQLAELIGEPGSGKTFVAIGMALSLASGRNLGMHNVPDRVKVLYVAAEAAESIYLRALGWWHHHKIDPQTQDGWFTVYPQPLQLGDPEHMRQVARYATENDVGLVVFDTRALVTLGLDENSSGDQGVAIEACKTLNRAGTAVLVVHHTPKDGATGGGGRGSGAWFAAVYTSMYLKHFEQRAHLVCDKNKDRAGGCKHPLNYDDVTLAPAMMTAARTEEERSTRALITVDPFTEDTGIGASGLNPTQLSTLLAIARFAGPDGLTAAMLIGLSESMKDDGHNIGASATVYRSLTTLDTHVKLVKLSPKTYRVSDTGWDLLLTEGLVSQDFADTHRHTVADLGTQPYLEAVNNIRAALDGLADDGTIIRGSSTMTDAKRLVQSHMSERNQKFSLEAWSQAYPAWR